MPVDWGKTAGVVGTGGESGAGLATWADAASGVVAVWIGPTEGCDVMAASWVEPPAGARLNASAATWAGKVVGRFTVCCPVCCPAMASAKGSGVSGAGAGCGAVVTGASDGAGSCATRGGAAERTCGDRVAVAW